jgi:hypothetical protein
LAVELARSIRKVATQSAHEENPVRLTPKLTRSAAHFCLTLAKDAHTKGVAPVGVDVGKLLERSIAYAFDLASAGHQFQPERIAALIVCASTVRVHGEISGKDRLAEAMEVIKTAEAGLLNYPSRRQLWLRFYLERAQIYLAGALRPGESKHREYATYCRFDLAAVDRLADGAQLWSHRVSEVRAHLSDGVRADGPSVILREAGF